MDDPNKDKYGEHYAPLSVSEWVQERIDNCLRHSNKQWLSKAEMDGWLEDAQYYRSIKVLIVDATLENERLRKIISFIPAKDFIKAKEAAGFGDEIVAWGII